MVKDNTTIADDIEELQAASNEYAAAAIAVMVASGRLDACLDHMHMCIVERRRIMTAQKALEMRAVLRTGTRVRISDKINPQYLRSNTGVVSELREGKVVVTLDPRYRMGRFANGKVVCPANCVELEATRG